MNTQKIAKNKIGLFIVFAIFLILIIIDIVNYRTISNRRNMLFQELKIDTSVEETIKYLETNKKRFHISDWRYTGYEDGNKWQPTEYLFINIDGPFSLYALIKEYEGAWYILVLVDRETGQVLEIR